MNTTTSTGTIALLERIHDGDLAALDELLQRDVNPGLQHRLSAASSTAPSR